MSIINHTIPPTPQPVFPPKCSGGTQDVCRHLPMALPLHGSHSRKSLQDSSLKKTSLSFAKGDSAQSESFCRGANVDANKERFRSDSFEGSSIDGISNFSYLLGNCNEAENSNSSIDHPIMRVMHDEVYTTGERDRMVEFESIPVSLLRSLSEKEEINTVKDGTGELDHVSSVPNFVLSVSVSSAVKLDARQIDLIARKMQRLTGFRELRIENIIDPTLIAGFVIGYDNDESQVIDLSVKGQLSALAARIESSDQRIANRG